MSKSENTVTYTIKQIRDMVARGDDRTDWAKVDAKAEAQLEADIASDPDARIDESGGVWVRVPTGYDVKLVKKTG